jgi:two-component system, sporulation sensor kinase E
VESGRPGTREFHYTGEGLDHWFRNIAVQLEDGFMVTFADITDEKQAQEASLETTRIALTGQIMRTIAHELRNPLTNVHLAVDQLKEETPAGQETYFQIIQRNLERIGTLIREMLESSKSRDLALATCTLEEVIENVRMAICDRLALKGMHFQVEITETLPEIQVDQKLLVLALTNLATNAVEAMQEGKGVLTFRAYYPGSDLRLEIADNGKGMTEEEMRNIFQPFYSNRPGGLGLGLTTSRVIFNEHGMKLDVRSEPGAGTTFILRLPNSLLAQTEGARLADRA